MSDNTRDRVCVNIYTRPGCHLCEEAKAEIARANCSDLFTLEEINIDADPDLIRRFGYDIPVVTINGGNRVAPPITEERLRRALSPCAAYPR